MFFFVNDEEFRRPASATNTRTILNPLAQTGVFQLRQRPDRGRARAGRDERPDRDHRSAGGWRLLDRIRAATDTEGHGRAAEPTRT